MKGSRLPRRRKELAELRLTPEGWVYLVVLVFITVGAVLRNVNLLIFMAGMMYAPLLLNWRLGLRRIRSLTASRRISRQLHANETASIHWTCRNKLHGIAAWNVVINDRIERVVESEQTIEENSGSLNENPESWSSRMFGEIFSRFRRRKMNPNRSEAKLGFACVKACESEVDAYQIYFGNRGKYVFGPAALSTTFPFGLIVCRVFLPMQKEEYVAPETGQLKPTWEQRVQAIATGSETIKRRRALEEDEFYALRPWRSGDSKKNIHWRTTAKLGQPIIKQHDQPNNRDFALILDLFDPQESDGNEACERVLSFAATTILQLGTAVQGKIAVGICGRQFELCHSRSQQSLIAAVLPRLSVAQTSADPDLLTAMGDVAQRVSTGTPLYVVSSRPCPAVFSSRTAGRGSASQVPESNDSVQAGGKTARLLRQVMPQIRWLDVESKEFRSIFQMEQDPIQIATLKELSSKWATDARS